jgi:hypothetical protein
MSGEGEKHATTRQPTKDKDTARPDMGSPQLTDTPAGPKLGAAEQVRIGQKLAEFYKHLLDQPVPDRFRQLLSELERQTEEH